MSNNFTPRHPTQSRQRVIKPYSPFPTKGEVYLRDASGSCAKAVFQHNSFIWVDIDPADFPAANSAVNFGKAT